MRKEIILIAAVIWSVGIRAADLSPQKRHELVCKSFSSKLEDKKRAKKVCKEFGKIIILKKILNDGKVVVENVELDTSDINGKILKDVSYSYSASIVKSITYSLKGKEKVNFSILKDKIEVSDKRNKLDWLEEKLESINVGNGDYVIEKFDVSKFKFSDLVDEAKELNEDKYVSAKAIPGNESINFSYGDNSEVEDYINSLINEGSVLGTLKSNPSDECDVSEYCSSESFELYFKDGRYLSITFDFNT